MRDRFTRGLIAGIIAGIAPFIFNLSAFMLNFSTLRWSDYMELLLYGYKPVVTGELVYAIVAVFFLLGLLGIGFAFLVPLFSSNNFLLKGIVYGLAFWFIAFALTYFLQLPGINYVPLKTVISNSVSALLWGALLGLALNWLDVRLKV